jgi:hypothetical protein
MRPLTVAGLIALAAAAAAPAFAAQPTHLNDVQFVEANRCLGLMSSKSIGTQDASAMAQLVKAQDTGRIGYVYERADQARDDAKRQADHAGTENARLIAERDGVCRSFIGSGSTEASGAHGDASQMMR